MAGKPESSKDKAGRYRFHFRSANGEIVLATACLLTGVVLAACGGGGGSSATSTAGGRSATSAAPSNAPASTSSESYQEGLKAGTDGQAEIAAFGGMGDAPNSYQKACQMSFDLDGGADPTLVKKDYMAGCLYGLNHQSAQWTQGRKAKGGK